MNWWNRDSEIGCRRSLMSNLKRHHVSCCHNHRNSFSQPLTVSNVQSSMRLYTSRCDAPTPPVQSRVRPHKTRRSLANLFPRAPPSTCRCHSSRVVLGIRHTATRRAPSPAKPPRKYRLGIQRRFMNLSRHDGSLMGGSTAKQDHGCRSHWVREDVTVGRWP
jgi:hypothetical protein